MTLIKTAFKNTTFLFIAQIASYIISFFTLIYATRYLGPVSFGIISLAWAISSLICVFSDMGLNTLAVREIAREKKLLDKYVSNILSIKLLLSILTFVLALILVKLMGYDTITSEVIFIIIASVIITSFSQTFYSVFQAYAIMKFQSINVILSSIMTFIGVLSAIYLSFDLILFSFVYLVVSLIILSCNLLIYLKNFILPSFSFDLIFWKDSIKESVPFAITSISISMYLWIDTILLSLIKGQEIVGIYSAAYRLIIVLLSIPVVMGVVVFPIMSRFHVSSKKSLEKIFKKFLKLIIVIGVPIAVGTTILAKKIILLIYGEQFIGSIIALQILIWSLVLTFARSPIERLLESSNRQLSVTKIFILGVIFNVTLNIIFIPLFSYVGAAIITVFTDIFVFLILFRMINVIGIKFSKSAKIIFFKIVFASMIMGVIISLLEFLDIFLLIFVGINIYVISILLLKVFDETEVSMIKSIFRGN